MALLHPRTGGEAGEQGTVDLSAGPGVQIFNDRILSQSSALQASGELPVLPLHEFHVHDEGEPVLEGEVMDLRVFQLGTESSGHAGESHTVELVDSRVDKHLFLLCVQW